MKNIHFALLLLLAMGTSSCITITSEVIYGSGDVISEERPVAGFEGLRVSSGIDVNIKQGESESMVVRADDNLMEHIQTEVEDNVLKIYTRKNIRRAKAMQVDLEYKSLNSIRISSAGDVNGENTLHTDNLRIGLSSAGDLRLDVEAEEIRCNISSSGDARLSGNAGTLVAHLSSAGDLYAFDLLTRECRVSCSSAGSARIHVTENADLRSSSAGSIYYRGDPNQITRHTSSAGSIVKRSL